MPAADPFPGVEWRRVGFEFKGDDGDKGVGTALVSKTNVPDTTGDLIQKGAFGGARWQKEVPLLPNHKWYGDDPPLGMISVREKANDVIARFRLNTGLAKAKEWLSHLKFAETQEFSIGFKIPPGGAKWLSEEEMEERGDGVDRIIKKLDLHEVSFVVAGAMSGTELISLKGKGERPVKKIEDDAPTLSETELRSVFLGHEIARLAGGVV